MARPDIVDQVHAAKYELQIASAQNKAKCLQRYEQLLEQAAKEFQTSSSKIQQAIRRDYGIWLRQNNLHYPAPDLPKPQDT